MDVLRAKRWSNLCNHLAKDVESKGLYFFGGGGGSLQAADLVPVTLENLPRQSLQLQNPYFQSWGK